jgi:hypothetical protein
MSKREKAFLEELKNGPKASEQFPEGRYFYYEGNDFEAFANELVEKFGFDPRKDCSYHFHCPAEFLDKIRDEDYPLGT